MRFKFCLLNSFSPEQTEKTLLMLSNEQITYIKGLAEGKRKQSLAVRTLLCEMLSDGYPDINIGMLTAEENGRPYFADGSIYVSFTHSDDMVGCVLSGSAVGVDIQKIKPVSDRLVSRVCTADEQLYVKEHGTDCFFFFWTLKESYIKATGISFADAVKVSFAHNGKICATDKTVDIDFGFTDGYVWSVCKKK